MRRSHLTDVRALLPVACTGGGGPVKATLAVINARTCEIAGMRAGGLARQIEAR